MTGSLDDFLGNDAFWRQVADFASSSYQQYARGAVLLHEQDARRESDNRAHIAISYLPCTDVSPLWTSENKAMAQEYQPLEEFLLISIQQNGEALSLIMERRDSPPS